MSTTSLSLDEATRISETAFLPYRGIAHPDPSDASFSLRVVGEDDRELLSIAHVAVSQYSNPVHLAGLLEEARLELSKDGCHLTPWSMPFQPDAVG